MELKVIKADGDYTHVALCGRLDIDGVTSVEMNFTNVVSAKGKPAIVDMTEVSFIASLGMRMLLSAAKALRESMHPPQCRTTFAPERSTGKVLPEEKTNFRSLPV